MMRISYSSLARRELLLFGGGVLALGACGSLGGGLPPQTPPATVHEVTTQEVRFSNGGVALAGTLYKPSGVPNAPGVVFGHGSGDVARPNRRFTFEAEGLATRGVACLVFDKRGCGQSSGDWRTSTFQDLAGDLRAAYDFMRAQPGIHPNKVGLRGASQAGWIMPIAASQAPQPAFMIMISGAMITIGEQIAYESETAINAADLTQSEKQQAMALTRQALDYARTGAGGEAYFARVREVAGERWYRASPTPGESEAWFFEWLRSIFAFDPSSYFQMLTMPVLAYFGERDTLVPARIARQSLEALYRDERASLLTVIEYPGAGHDLRYPNEAGDPILAPDYLNQMAVWIVAASAGAD
jgi:uncharacterized protein